MVTTSYIDIPPALEELFFKSLRAGDRFMHARMVRKRVLYSRKSKAGVSQKSMLPVTSEAWATLSDVEKEAWSTAGAECNLNGWRLFVKDYIYRVVNGLSGIAVPTILHQAFVGELNIEAPASEIRIEQYHPRTYWVSQKVVGFKNMYAPAIVTEDISLPLEISLNYKSDLSVVSSPNFAKCFAIVWSSYQGVDRFTNLEIPLDYSCAWKNATATLSSVIGHLIGYTLVFHLKGVTGSLYFDNVKAIHSGQNWVRDSFCDSIALTFTRAFYQIPKNWAADILPDGAHYASIYKDF